MGVDEVLMLVNNSKMIHQLMAVSKYFEKKILTDVLEDRIGLPELHCDRVGHVIINDIVDYATQGELSYVDKNILQYITPYDLIVARIDRQIIKILIFEVTKPVVVKTNDCTVVVGTGIYMAFGRYNEDESIIKESKFYLVEMYHECPITEFILTYKIPAEIFKEVIKIIEESEGEGILTINDVQRVLSEINLEID